MTTAIVGDEIAWPDMRLLAWCVVVTVAILAPPCAGQDPRGHAPPSAPPALEAPAILKATVLDGEIQIEWQDNSPDESFNVVRVEMRGRAPREDTLRGTGRPPVGRRTYHDGQATAPGEYTYTVTAVRSIRGKQQRISSAKFQVTRPRPKPTPDPESGTQTLAAPTDLVAIEKPDGNELTWTDNAPNEGAYLIEVTGARRGEFELRERRPRTGRVTWLDRESTKPGRYGYTVTAYLAPREAGNRLEIRSLPATARVTRSSPPAVTTPTVPEQPPIKLPAPTGLTATVEPDGIEVAWQDRATGESGYKITVEGARDGTMRSMPLPGQPPTGPRSILDRRAITAGRYTYTVAAFLREQPRAGAERKLIDGAPASVTVDRPEPEPDPPVVTPESTESAPSTTRPVEPAGETEAPADDLDVAWPEDDPATEPDTRPSDDPASREPAVVDPVLPKPDPPRSIPPSPLQSEDATITTLSRVAALIALALGAFMLLVPLLLRLAGAWGLVRFADFLQTCVEWIGNPAPVRAPRRGGG